MAGASANMPRLIALGLISMSAKMCSAQPPAAGEIGVIAGTTEPPIVQPPTDVLCPLMTRLTSGTYLQTDPWSLMRAVNVRQRTTLYDESEEAQIAGTTMGQNQEAQQHWTTLAPSQALQPAQLGSDILIGKVTSVFFSWSNTYEIRDPMHNKLIAKLVTPGAFWDTTQDFYNCKDQRIGSIRYKFNWDNYINNRYTEHEILDSAGNHIANLGQVEGNSKGFLGSRQFFIYVKDLSGAALASMRHTSMDAGWKIGPWSENFEADIEMETQNQLAPPPSMEPEFISLVFANSLAMDFKYGPYWTFIIDCILLVLMFFCCFCGCCCLTPVANARHKIEEEAEELLGIHKSEEKKEEGSARDFWNCCSRKVAPENSKMESTFEKMEKSGKEFTTKVHGKE